MAAGIEKNETWSEGLKQLKGYCRLRNSGNLPQKDMRTAKRMVPLLSKTYVNLEKAQVLLSLQY